MSNSAPGRPPSPEWQPGDQPPPWAQPTPSLPPGPPAPDWGPSAAFQSAPDYEVPAGRFEPPPASYQPSPPPYQPPAPPYGVVVPSTNPYGTNPYAAGPYGSNPYAPSPYAPYGVDPATGLPYSDKSKLVAGLLQVFLGSLGIGRFYLGDIGMGVAQILVTFLTLGLGALWPLIDGIMLLAGSPRDRNGRPLRP
ncbi:MAG TPA: NINE protein [Propionibacteriaceae bacterium]|nr:NINE protein [Propionibacteriaceae bacterium]